jgi:outer membrane protein OmpA-like peptidoglycan-associated protein
MQFTLPIARPAVTLVLMLAITAAATGQEDLRATLFEEANAALKTANTERAAILAPTSYGSAAEKYRSAEDKLERGRRVTSITRDLEDAARLFDEATESARLAKLTLVSAIEARDDADSAGAAKYAAEAWQDAEEKFASAAARLEAGNIKSARSRSDDAQALFRTAELAAIKANYLDETARLIAKAKDDRVDRIAPRTLAKAERLLADAERLLTDNRYDTDQPRDLARRAKYEALHAVHLARILEPVRDRDTTLEDLALDAEQPISQIAAALELVAELDRGFDEPTRQIIERIRALQQDAYALNQRNAQIAGLEHELEILEGQLGIQSARLASQERQREQVARLESMFSRDEAQVLIDGSNILIRMAGLAFETGSAQIDAQYFALLRKLQDAIAIFPGSSVVVEGHTDAFGGDEQNLQLSQDRATSVREYLLANMPDRVNESITAVGYGEARPVGNNETPEGRTRNRRIDLVITPSPQAL